MVYSIIAQTSQSTTASGGMEMIHVVYIAVGILIGLAIFVPLSLYMLRKNKKRGSKLLALGKKEAHTERAKADIILASIEDGVVLVGTDNTIQSFNRGAEQLTGWKAKDAIGLDYHAVIKLLDAKGQVYEPAHDPFAKSAQALAVVRDTEAVLETTSKTQVPIYLSVSPIIIEDKQVGGVVGIFRDVSQERAEEQQRAEFISTASHEMRTPVAAIEGYLALALNAKVSNIDAKARSYLEKAHESTQHLGQLFQDLLTSAKAEDGRLVSHPQVVEMGALVETISDGLRFSTEKKGLIVDYILGTDTQGSSNAVGGNKVIQPLYYVYADPDRLREVVTNLFDNAVKYTERGKITIGLTGNNEVVQLYVQDTGAGIPAEDISHLFQKFYRVDSSATRTVGGTGLGLFICRKVVELYNGRIWVESQLGQGSTFYINLPRLSAEKAASLQTQQPATP